MNGRTYTVYVYTHTASCQCPSGPSPRHQSRSTGPCPEGSGPMRPWRWHSRHGPAAAESYPPSRFVFYPIVRNFQFFIKLSYFHPWELIIRRVTTVWRVDAEYGVELYIYIYVFMYSCTYSRHRPAAAESNPRIYKYTYIYIYIYM